MKQRDIGEQAVGTRTYGRINWKSRATHFSTMKINKRLIQIVLLWVALTFSQSQCAEAFAEVTARPLCCLDHTLTPRDHSYADRQAFCCEAPPTRCACLPLQKSYRAPAKAGSLSIDPVSLPVQQCVLVKISAKLSFPITSFWFPRSGKRYSPSNPRAPPFTV
jgi:hypothetical protein